MYKSYETERLILKPTTEEDAAFVLKLLNTPKWIAHIGNRNVHTLEEAITYIQERMLPQLERLGYGNYTIIRKNDGIKMGSCGLYDRKGLEGVDIGYAFLPEYYGNGYAIESALRMRDLAFSEFGNQKISAITTTANLASQKILEKLGMKFIKMVTLPNDDEELMLYELGIKHK